MGCVEAHVTAHAVSDNLTITLLLLLWPQGPIFFFNRSKGYEGYGELNARTEQTQNCKYSDFPTPVTDIHIVQTNSSFKRKANPKKGKGGSRTSRRSLMVRV